MIDTTALLVALLAGATVVLLVATVVRPPAPLAQRLRPYNAANRARLGLAADLPSDRGGLWVSADSIRSVINPIVRQLVDRLGRVIEQSSDEELLKRFRQAGLYQDRPADERLHLYRQRRLMYVLGGSFGLALPGIVRASGPLIIVGLVAGLIAGVAWPRGQLDQAVTERCERIRLELFTVDQQLAYYLSSSIPVAEALRRLVRRSQGVVSGELAEALTWHRAGLPLEDALAQLTELSLEPFAQRTYRVLATAAAGGRVGETLQGLSKDVRDYRRDGLARLATRRRAAMIIPTVFVMIPTMVLLIGTPLITLFGEL
jgi:tight adherence protein C